MIARLRRKRAVRELYGYAILAGVAAVAVVNFQRAREYARWGIHRAAELVPAPESEDDADA